ncbi:ADP-ribosylation factor-related protein 1-like [Haliotis rubra]|uniref:ADP-ribosylation factor-related protein 1-like n=1 Tax=Haliotis rubra TaxID=36100 RepID=UPI001EE61946|nr:ADP-ribosylation factor-related protein 1-like [Haliotis rubra]XP_046554653.1 ADP-ribosylation factor-related protein 1-like [Haliotis rubra]
MYTLLSGLYKYLFQKDEYFVLILGLDNAGKTTYLEQTKTKFNRNYQGMNLSKITSTVGLNIGKIDLGKVRLNFWDLGGQEELQSLWDKYYAESHAVIYIVDSSDTERIEESKAAFDKMITNNTLAGVPLMLLANKQDLDGCVKVSDMRTVFSPSQELIGHRDLHVSGVSALKGDGVNEGIHWLVESIKKNSIQRPPTLKEIT